MSIENRSERQPPPPPQVEAQQRPEIKKLHQPFLIASVCRADLQGILTAEEIAQLDDCDMERIAEKMADNFRDSGGYWDSLEINARFILKQQDEGNR